MATVQHPFLNDGVEARAYQFNALNYCLSASTLMVMPTGFGKTAVEWMAMANCLHKKLGKVLLIAPTTGLVDQQQRMARAMINIDEKLIITYTGENTPANRPELWNNGTIIIATPQVIRNDVQNGLIDLTDLGLLIFDEAHHATGNHAYSQVGKLIAQENPNCTVIGATASPGSTEAGILEVANNLNIRTFSISKKESSLLQAYKVNMQITPHYLELNDEIKKIIQPLEVHQNSEAEQLRKMGFLAPTGHITSKLIENAQRSASIAIQRRDARGYNAARKISNLRRVHILLDLLRTQGLKSAQAFVERAEEDGRSGQRGTNSFIALPCIHKFRNASKQLDELHPKPAHAAELVSRQLKDSPDSKVLIFTEYRDTVELLTDKLNSIEGIVADRFIGQSGTGSRKGMNQKQQLAQLQRFREGDINVLIATSVGEEGLDVPAADLVILYEPVPSAIRTIQRRGRTARQRDGEVHILITKDTRDVFVYIASKRREEKMYTLLERIKKRGRMIFVEPPKDVLSDFTVLDGGENISAVDFLAAEKERLEKLFPVIETIAPEDIAEAKPEVKNESNRIPVISPAMRRPSNQMGLDSFIATSDTENPIVEKVAEVTITQDIQSKTQWNVILDGSEQKLIDKEDAGHGIIQVDHREASTTFVAHMRSLQCNIQLTHLYHGDVRISDRVLIERKSSRDIISSLIDGRLLSQCRRLLASAPRPLLLVETGTGNGHAVHPNAVLGALAHITLDLGVPVMMTKDAKESAHFISIVAKREFDLLEKLAAYSLTKKSPADSQKEEIDNCISAANKEILTIINEQEENGPLAKRWDKLVSKQRVEVLAAIPNLGMKKAQLLLEHFGTVAAVLCANENELSKVEGIGPATASTIQEILHA
jgi:Fanconi anemia group M protein